MTRRPEDNRDLIHNFLLYMTHCGDHGTDDNFQDPQTYTPEQMYQICDDYLAEDHVDGYERDEEILIQKWLDAEEANRNGDDVTANRLKGEFSTLFQEDWIDKEYVTEYLESIGG